jgi:hypothetical protein
VTYIVRGWGKEKNDSLSLQLRKLCDYTNVIEVGGSYGAFHMLSVIIDIYNKKTEGPTLMELFRAAVKLK